MEIALITIGRLENQYAIEFVEYYINLGFDHIFIGDNNHDGEEYFEDVLQEYINKNLVTIIDKRNQIAIQKSFYKEMYEKYQNKYDWLAFYDFDEFLILNKHNNIKDYLKEPVFHAYNQILINWRIYTDNDLIINDNRPCLERFTTPMQEDKKIAYDFPQNNHVKSIIRGKLGIKDIYINNPHHFTNSLISNLTCNSIGNKVQNKPFVPYIFDLAYIKHFTTKTIDEWLNLKKLRGVGDRDIELFMEKYNIDLFFKINNKTIDKINFINNYQNKLY